MKKLFARVVSFVSSLDSTKVRMVLMVVTLALLVLGAAAPDDGGGFIGR